MPELQRRRTDKGPAGLLQYLQDLRQVPGRGEDHYGPVQDLQGSGQDQKIQELKRKDAGRRRYRIETQGIG